MMTVTMDIDEGVTVEGASDVEWFHKGLLEQIAAFGSAAAATLDDGILTIRADNGTWRYQIDYLTVGDDPGTVRGVLLGVDDPPGLGIQDWEVPQ